MSEKEQILKELFPEWNNYLTEAGIKNMSQAMQAYADQEKRKDVAAFLLWLDLSDWVFIAGSNQFENALTGEIDNYDFVYDLYLKSLPKTDKP